MKAYRCYLKAILLSVLAAIAIDATVNFDQYQRTLLAGFTKKMEQEKMPVGRFTPSLVGKVISIFLHF